MMGIAENVSSITTSLRRRDLSQRLDRSLRRRLLAELRRAHRCLGMKRKRLALGVDPSGLRICLAAVAVAAGATAASAATTIGNGNLGAGSGNAATGTGAIAGGNGSTATGNGSVAVGNGATTTQIVDPVNNPAPSSGVAIGNNARSTYDGSIAIGQNTAAAGSYNPVATPGTFYDQGYLGIRTDAAVAINNTAPGTTSFRPSGVAIGELSTVNVGGGVALGYNNAAGSGSNFSTAIGATNLASGAYATALGSNNIASNTAAVALGVNNQATGNRAIALGRASYAFGDFSIAQGSAASGYGTNAIALGNTSVAGVNGGAATADVAIGNAAAATGGTSVALGNAATASAANAISIGNAARAMAAQAISIGNGNTVSGANSGAFGDPTTITGTGSYSVGNGNAIASNNSFVLGNGIAVPAGFNGSVTLGSGAAPSAPVGTAAVVIGGNTYAFAGAAPVASVSVGAPGTERTITNVAAGRINNASTDAVNGSQLFATSTQVGANTAAIAGNTAAITNLGNSVGNGAVGPIQRGAAANQLVAVAAGGTAANPGAAQTLTNIAPGAVNANSTDAVNGSQLSATNANVAANTANIATNGNNIAGNTARTNALGAGTAADLGGGAAYNPATGALSAPAYPVYGATQTSVGNAIAALQTRAPLQYSTAAAPTTPSATATPSNDVTLVGANAAAPVALHNLAAGAVTAASTDAVNGSQLFGTAQSLANDLGGGAAVNANGTVSAPSYTVGANQYNNVGGAIGALNTGLAGGQIGAFRSNNTAGAAQPVAAGANSDAGGFGSSATGAASTVVGNNATDNGNANSTVLGNGASVAAGLAGSNVALGQGTAATRGAQANYAAFGDAGAQVSAGEVAVGSAAAPRQVTGVAAGSAATDAVNVGQLQGAAANLGTAIANDLGGGATYNPATGQVTAPGYTIGANTYNNAGAAFAAVNGAISGGSGIKYFHADSTGPDSVAAGIDSVAVGPAATSGAARAIAMGANAAATGADSVALGSGSVAGAANAPAVGTAATLTNASGAPTTIGYNTTDRTLLGPLSVGSATTYRQIQNVADGQAPTDAVNVRQLQGGVQTAINYTDTYAVKYAANGVTLASPYAGGPVVIRNVGAGAVTATSTDAVNGSQLYGLQQVAVNAVSYDTTAAGTRSNTVTFAGGNPNAPVRLSNVAAGIAGTDAVNVNQLNNFSAYTQNQLNALNQGLTNTNRALRGGIALALGAAGLRYDDRPGRLSVAMGAAGYAGSAGLAFGLGGTSDDGRWRYNGAVSFSPNNDRADVGVFGGASYTFFDGGPVYVR